MTAWIDGSFIYSTSEAWLNAMRSFQNGTLLTVKSGKMPVRNTMRVPLFNNPVPHVMKMMSPERLFRKFYCFLKIIGFIELYDLMRLITQKTRKLTVFSCVKTSFGIFYSFFFDMTY